MLEANKYSEFVLQENQESLVQGHVHFQKIRKNTLNIDKDNF